MKAEIRREYTAYTATELSIDHNGFNYLVIIGQHINGWYIAIPNWNVCTEAGNPVDSFYNREKLANALNDVSAGIELAGCIADWWKNNIE